ncbi:exodeoxyribonuclease III [Legionella impletisoli]|uniref:Exodeoxyribonuclease III n=1 Tax=Legionella impletisoli TaxID=343510 RepID=A0A917JY76_9GAMM|nr:exodeoxyribonuclease III [Legionella impletisoli]GGI91977.1 exodeoxyribonuclease III [Legionella impletisoli]
MLKLASWNVNSLKVRLEQVIHWLSASNIDVLAIQETKLLDENFPAEAFTVLGYHVVYSGQKTYNGVAIISREPMQEVMMDIPNLEDPQRRILTASIGDLRLVNLYVPNGSEVGSEKYVYKLHWLERVTQFLKEELNRYASLAVVGDFNIAPEDIDVHDPKAWEGSVLVSPPEREALTNIMNLGLNDSFRVLHPGEQAFSWWDYRQGGFRRNHGLRIDHILLSDELQSRCSASEIDIVPRKNERPSDHAPIWVNLEL